MKRTRGRRVRAARSSGVSVTCRGRYKGPAAARARGTQNFRGALACEQMQLVPNAPRASAAPSLLSRLLSPFSRMAAPPKPWQQPTHFTSERWWERDGGAVALVTGGNQGIGYQCVRQLAAQGVTAVLASRDAARGAAAAAALSAELGRPVHSVQLDVTDAESIRRCAEDVRQRFSGVDILLNNAGIAFKGNTFDAQSARATLATNLSGTAAVTAAFLPRA